MAHLGLGKLWSRTVFYSVPRVWLRAHYGMSVDTSQVNQWMVGWGEWVVGWLDRCMDGWMDGWVGGRMGRWIDGWVDRRHLYRSSLRSSFSVKLATFQVLSCQWGWWLPEWPGQKWLPSSLEDLLENSRWDDNLRCWQNGMLFRKKALGPQPNGTTTPPLSLPTAIDASMGASSHTTETEKCLRT